MYEAFIGPIPHDKEIHHINGIKCDNRLSNLDCISHSTNHILDRKNKSFVINEEAAKVIKWALINRDDLTCADLARIHGVGKHIVKDISRRKTWNHVQI